MPKIECITFSLGFRIVLLIIGIIIIVTRPQDSIIPHAVDLNIALVNGTVGYSIWKNVDLEMKIYLFHVVNPEEVQNHGDVAILVEYGPYIYDDHLERIVLEVNDSADTIEYLTSRTLIFNATKSGNYSEEDEITIPNAAYLGTMLTIARKFAPFISTFGNRIPLLFPDSTSMFVRGRVKDILFDGLPLVCDTVAHPELTMICSVLKNSRPPIVRPISDNGTYAWSFFHKINGTLDGPYTISRGKKDRYTAAYISKFKGSNYAEYWSVENCSLVQGSDSIFYSPISHKKTRIFSFASDLCRSIYISYAGDKVYNGLLGYHYKTTKDFWDGLESSCYCPRAEDGTINCPLPGALDLDTCQEAPVLMTEPHFLHGASDLFSIIQGLRADEEKHASYVVIEPLTGMPLSGSRNMQLNMMLQPLSVDLLANVSHGMFPLVWISEGSTPGAKRLEAIIFMHRVIRVVNFLTWIPLIFGTILIWHSYWMNAVRNKNKYQRTSGRVTVLAPKNPPCFSERRVF